MRLTALRILRRSWHRLVHAIAVICGALAWHDASAVVDATFDCDGGAIVAIRFFDDRAEAKVTLPGSDERVVRELAQLPSADGYRYGDDSVELRGRGREMTLRGLSGIGSLTCRERRPA